jgi:ADP-ribosylglycohydrolase
MLYGALLGDIIGSLREIKNEKTEDIELFPKGSHFTDDSVMTIAIADKLIHDDKSSVSNKKAYAMWYKQYYRRFPHAGYGQMFSSWANEDGITIQKSYGNGCAMRVTALGYACDDLKTLWKEVEDSCYYTHNNHEAKTGAKAIATAVFMANKQEDKESIKSFISRKFKYQFRMLDEIRDKYVFDSRTSYCVPPALEAFFESTSYETAIRKAISIGGDSDTIACMTGGIAEAYYKCIPEKIMAEGSRFIDGGFKNVISDFTDKFLR